jgi:predicted regulator of Ras-like GTPase activity (Roadblock/LC7/MglB family)
MRIAALDAALLSQVDAIFKRLQVRTPSIRGALLSSIDGRPMHRDFDNEPLAERLAAMSSAALSLGASMSNAVGIGDCQGSIAFASEGLVVLQRVPRHNGPELFVLTLLASNDAHSVLLLHAARHASSELCEVLPG